MRQQSFIGELCRAQQAFVEGAALRHKPAHPNTAFAQSGNLPRGALVRAAAKQLEDYNVGISVGDVMAEASWVDVADFPIAELQVDGDFINGCADDRAKRMACEMAVEIAKKLNTRTLAKNIERTADCRVACQMEFDAGQGFLFAKPMEAHRFARTMLRRRSAAPD